MSEGLKPRPAKKGRWSHAHRNARQAAFPGRLSSGTSWSVSRLTKEELVRQYSVVTTLFSSPTTALAEKTTPLTAGERMCSRYRPPVPPHGFPYTVLRGQRLKDAVSVRPVPVAQHAVAYEGPLSLAEEDFLASTGGVVDDPLADFLAEAGLSFDDPLLADMGFAFFSESQVADKSYRPRFRDGYVTGCSGMWFESCLGYRYHKLRGCLGVRSFGRERRLTNAELDGDWWVYYGPSAVKTVLPNLYKCSVSLFSKVRAEKRLLGNAKTKVQRAMRAFSDFEVRRGVSLLVEGVSGLDVAAWKRVLRFLGLQARKLFSPAEPHDFHFGGLTVFGGKRERKAAVSRAFRRRGLMTPQPLTGLPQAGTSSTRRSRLRLLYETGHVQSLSVRLFSRGFPPSVARKLRGKMTWQEKRRAKMAAAQLNPRKGGSCLSQ